MPFEPSHVLVARQEHAHPHCPNLFSHFVCHESLCKNDLCPLFHSIQETWSSPVLNGAIFDAPVEDPALRGQSS